MHIQRLFEPSGKTYEAFDAFSRAHPEASFFQSGRFFSMARAWPEAEVVLLVAAEEAGYGNGKQAGEAAAEKENQTETRTETAGGKRFIPVKWDDRERYTRLRICGSILAVVVREQHGLLRKLTARTIVYGGPLISEGTRFEREMCLTALLEALHQHTSGRSLYTQFRNHYDLSPYHHLFKNLGYASHDRLNLIVGTDSEEAAWKGISQSRQRQIRKSLKNDARIIANPTPAQIDDFYLILKDLYRGRIRKPLPSRAFFSVLSEPSHGVVLLVSYQNQIIGGIACPLLPAVAMYEWYVCGLDREFKSRHIYPSALATWAGIRYAAQNGIPRFDFMGLGKPEEKYGVRDFKARFGGQWVNHGRFSRVNKPLWYFFVELAYNAYRLLK